MGYKNRAEAETETCLSEAFLFATMCIIGLPVDVHIRDGSVYSGTFHTASVDKEFGIVLKEAKLTKKGKCEANVASESIIGTLVILSGDLVQVIAKGVQFPANGVNGNVASDYVEAAVGNVPSSEIVESETKGSNNTAMDRKKINDDRNSVENKICTAASFMPMKAQKEHEGKKNLPDHTGITMEVQQEKRDGLNIHKGEEDSGASVIGRQIGDGRSQEDHDHLTLTFELQREKSDAEVQSSSSISGGSFLSEAKAVEEGKMMMKLLPYGVSPDPPPLTKLDNQCCKRSGSPGTSSLNTVYSSNSTASSPLVDVSSEAHSGSLASSADVVSPQSSEYTKSSKEFKLNPGAKIFCPSLTTPVSATAAVPAVAALAYVPSNYPMVPVAAAAQPEVGIGPFAPRPSVPSKFAPLTNFAAVNGGSGPQFSQPIVVHLGNRTQPLRYAGQYHAVQAAPAYVPPNSQAVVGRLGQLVYLQPVPHDLVQSTATVSPISARPVLTSNQVQYPKHQGSAAAQNLQLCAPPPFVASGQQPFAVPGHIPHLQPPIPTNRAISVSGSNALFGTRFSYNVEERWPEHVFRVPFQNTQGNHSENDPNNTTILAGALAPSVSDEHLRQVFSKYGELVQVNIPTGKRYGFVQFGNRLRSASTIDVEWNPVSRTKCSTFMRMQSIKQEGSVRSKSMDGGYSGYRQGYDAYRYAPPQVPNMYYGGYFGYRNYQQPGSYQQPQQVYQQP